MHQPTTGFFLEARDEFALFTDLLTDPTPFQQIHPQAPDLLLKLWALVLPGSQGSSDASKAGNRSCSDITHPLVVLNKLDLYRVGKEP